MFSVGKQGLAVAPQIESSIPKWPLILLVALTLIRGLLYLSIFPPFLAPDESAHFEVIRLIGQEKKWPTAQVYAVTPMHPEMAPIFEKFRIWSLTNLYSPVKHLGVTNNLFIDYYPTQIGGSEVIADSYLVLYHLSLAPLSAAIASFDLVTQVYILRLVSVLLTTLTVIIVWLTICSIFSEEKMLALAAGSFIVFWPMHSHVNASITVDGLVELFSCIFFFVLVKIYKQGFSASRVVSLLGSLGLAILTKPTAFFLLPTLVAALIIYFGRQLRGSLHITRILLLLLVIFTLVGSILLYQNSHGGRKLLLILSLNPSWPDWSRFVTVESLKLYLRSLNLSLISFGGLFGWSNIHIPWSWVRFWAGFLFFVGCGSLIFIYQHLLKPDHGNEKLSNLQQNVLIMFAFAIIFSLMGAIAPIITTQSPNWIIHSRYYFPAIIPIALYLFLGFRQLFPTRLRKLALPVWVSGWFAYDSLVLLLVVLPYLYK